MPKALVYGHSQAQPTGMGDDLVKALHLRGWQVSRTGLQGRNDRRLLAEASALGDIAGHDLVFLYAGGNSDRPSVRSLRALVQHFGPHRTIVILPPINVDGPPELVVTLRTRNRGNREGIADLVKVYDLEAPGAAFKPDGRHMRAGTPAGAALVAQILRDIAIETPAVAP